MQCIGLGAYIWKAGGVSNVSILYVSDRQRMFYISRIQWSAEFIGV